MATIAPKPAMTKYLAVLERMKHGRLMSRRIVVEAEVLPSAAYQVSSIRHPDERLVLVKEFGQ